MKTDLFQFCGHCWGFQICWHIECSTFTASSFRIWNSSTGIPSPPLVLCVVMLSKAHLNSYSRMSGSRWMVTPSWLAGLWRSFLYSSSVYPCHLFLISSASVRSTLSVLYWAHLCMKCSPGISNFLDEIPSLFHSLVSPISLHWSLMMAFLALLVFFETLHSDAHIFPFLFCFLLLFFSQLFVRPPKTAILFFAFLFLGDGLDPVSCTRSWTSVHISSGTLSNLVHSI